MALGDKYPVVYVDGDVPQRPLQLGQLLVDSSQISSGTTNLQQCTSQDPLVYEPLQGGYPRSPSEIAAGVVPTNYNYPPGNVLRYGADPTGGANSTDAFNNAVLGVYGTSKPSGIVTIPEGDYRIAPSVDHPTGNIEVLSGVSFQGSGAKYTRLLDYGSSGACLNCNVTLFNQFFQDFTIDGTNATDTRRALYINRGNRSRFVQVNVSGYTAVDDGIYAVFIEGALYGLLFIQCYYSLNKRHLYVDRIGTAGSDPANFPTACGWIAPIFEEATEVAGYAVVFTDTSGMWMNSPIFQANKSVRSLFINNTANAETGCDFKLFGRPWFEENGNGSATSSGIYIKGVSGNKCAGVTIDGLRMHGSPDNPRNSIYMEYTTGTRITDAGGALSGSTVFVADGGNNDDFEIDWRDTTDSCALKFPILWASANFNGVAGISVNSSLNLTPTRNSAGNYTLTFGKAAPAAGYLVQANAEDASASVYLIASPGPATSTASFNLFVSDAAGVPTDGRTIYVTVLAIPA